MGEYAEYNGDRIKIGTCEDMYYLRADQAGMVRALSGNVDPVKDRDELRFRFPFPDEDNLAPGEFDAYNRRISVYADVQLPDTDHHLIQFKATYPAVGILVSLPCPRSADGAASGITYHYNGFSGPVRFGQQRYLEGRLVLVVECGCCGSAWRMPDRDKAQPIIDALRAKGEKFFTTCADRIESGYAG
jgi:hypothetical protein